jgi:ArsR family metal-binding transcriptional regulator
MKCNRCGKETGMEFALCMKCLKRKLESCKKFDEWCDKAGRPSDEDMNRRMTI